MNNNKALISTLINMIKNDIQYFDQGIAEYILNNTPREDLEEKNIVCKNLKNDMVFSDIIGLVHAHNLTSPNEQHEIDNQQKIQKWENLLKDKVSKSVTYLLNKDKDENKISKNALIALTDLNLYLQLLKKEPNQYELSKTEKIILAKDWLEEESTTYFYFLDKDSDAMKFVTQTLSDNIDDIKKSMKKNDDEFANKVLNSKMMKKVVSLADSHTMSLLMPVTSLSAIIKKSNLKVNLKETPSMLSNLLHLATPEQWIKAETKDNIENFDLFKFFRPQFVNACGCNINDIQTALSNNYRWYGIINDRYNNRSNVGLKEFTLRIKYFAPFLKTIELDDKKLCLLYTMVALSGDPELYKAIKEIYPLPEQTSEYAKFFYEKLYIAPIFSYDRKNTTTFQSIDIEELYKKLDSETVDKTHSSTKIKI